MLAVFVVEANSKSKSDFMYINKWLHSNFDIEPEDVVRAVYLDGKGNFNKPSVEKEIGNLKKKYRATSRRDKREVVFFCIDTDDLSRTALAQDNLKELSEIADYCKIRDYELIWFHEVIEQLFLGKRVSRNKKADEARMFVQKEFPNQLPGKFACENYNQCIIGSSNMGLVLSRHFTILHRKVLK